MLLLQPPIHPFTYLLGSAVIQICKLNDSASSRPEDYISFKFWQFLIISSHFSTSSNLKMSMALSILKILANFNHLNFFYKFFNLQQFQQLNKFNIFNDCNNLNNSNNFNNLNNANNFRILNNFYFYLKNG
jgi:hypothetical protein